MNKHSLSRLSRMLLATIMALAALLALNSALSRAAHAAQPSLVAFTVSNTNDAGAGSLRQAILEANGAPGADVIEISVAGTVNLLGPLPTISEEVTLQGPGAALFSIDGQDLNRVLDIGAVDVSVADLTVQRGAVSGASGAGIRSSGNLTLTNVRVLSNTAQQGGGGVYVAGDVTVTDSVFGNNRSTNGVGGALRGNRVTVISGTQFLSNTSQGDGGAVFALGENLITGTLFQENQCVASSCDGGGLFAFSQTRVERTRFLSNTAQDDGGGAFIAGNVTVRNALFQDNRSVFSSGGGLGAQDTAVVQVTQFLSNTARGAGGGVSVFGSLTLSDALFAGNESETGQGGGLHAQGDLDADGVQFTGNTASEGGGLAHGLYDATVVNGLFVANEATDAVGSAVLLASSGSAQLRHLTVTGQGQAGGAAIEVITGSADIFNSIVASHTSGIQNGGASVFQDYNLFFANGVDTQGAVSGGAHSLSGDPAFVQPAAGDFHLTAGSMAVDAGTDVGVTRDFDGDVRPQGRGYDMGFDEVVQEAGPPTPTDYMVYLPVVRR